MIRIVLWSVAGFFWTVLFVLVGLYVTFPQAPLKERVEYESVKFTGNQFSVTTESIRPWWIGLKGSDVTIYQLKKARKTKENPETAYERRPLVTLDGLAVRSQPLALALGRQAASFVADLLGGSIIGSYAQSEAGVDIEFTADDLDLTRMASSSAEESIHFLGTLVGDANLHFDTADTKQSTGSLHLAINGFGIGAGSKAGGFGLPEASFEKAVLSAEVQEGKLEITEGVFEGSVLSASLSGTVSLNKKVGRSRNKLDLAFTLPEEYDQLAQLSPSLKRSKDEDGKYHCSVSGTLLQPTFRCGSKSTSSRTLLDRGTDRVDSLRDGGVDDEERRKQREERIRERRERLKKKREEAGLEDPRPPLEEDRRPPYDLVPEDEPPPDLPYRDQEPPMDRAPVDFPEDAPPGPPPDEMGNDD